jgi:CTP-dependent riboflavin kinase
MGAKSSLIGIIFSDLGQASRFMALEWVQELLVQRLGYHPFPATLNVRPKDAEDAETWRRIQNVYPGTPLTEASASHCGARLFRVEVSTAAIGKKVAGAVLVPEVGDYPPNKIEIVAPVRLKDHFAVRDGDQLTVEFLN